MSKPEDILAEIGVIGPPPAQEAPESDEILGFLTERGYLKPPEPGPPVMETPIPPSREIPLPEEVLYKLSPEELEQATQQLPIQMPEHLAPQTEMQLPPPSYQAPPPVPLDAYMKMMLQRVPELTKITAENMMRQMWGGGPSQVLGGLKQAWQHGVLGKPQEEPPSNIGVDVGRGITDSVKGLVEFIPKTAISLYQDPVRQITQDPVGTLFLASLLSSVAGRGLFKTSVDTFFRKAEEAGWPVQVLNRYREAIGRVGRPEGLIKEIDRYVKIRQAEIPPPKAPIDLWTGPTERVGPAATQPPVPVETPVLAQKLPTQGAVEPIIPAPAQPTAGVAVPPVMPTPAPQMPPPGPPAELPMEPVSAPSPGKRWTTDAGAMPGEPEHFLDVQRGDLDTAKAAIIPRDIENKVLYEVRGSGGNLIGQFQTLEEAARAAEVQTGKPAPPAPAAPTPKKRGAAKSAAVLHEPHKEFGVPVWEGQSYEQKRLEEIQRDKVARERALGKAKSRYAQKTTEEEYLVKENNILETQARILAKAGRPEKDIEEFVANTFMDGEELRRIANEVIYGEITEDAAAQHIQELIDATAHPEVKLGEVPAEAEELEKVAPPAKVEEIKGELKAVKEAEAKEPWETTKWEWLSIPEHEGVVNDAGKPIALYHGTNKPDFAISDWKPGAGGAAGPGIYLSKTAELANIWAGKKENARVIKVYATGKYLKLPYHEVVNAPAWAEKARRLGYAGLDTGMGEIVVFDNKNITQTPPAPITGYARKEGATHEEIVRRALYEGKAVPPEVLADYPHLAKPIKPAEPAFSLTAEAPEAPKPAAAPKPKTGELFSGEAKPELTLAQQFKTKGLDKFSDIGVWRKAVQPFLEKGAVIEYGHKGGTEGWARITGQTEKGTLVRSKMAKTPEFGGVEKPPAEEPTLVPGETVEEAIAGIKQEIAEKEPPETPKVGLSVQAVGGTLVPPAAGRAKPFTFQDPEIEKRFAAAKGIPTPKFAETALEGLRTLGHKMTRTYEHLANTKENAEAKQALKELAKQRGVAMDKAVIFLRGIQVELDKSAQDLIRRKVILDDLVAEAEEDHDLPFGFDKKTVKAERDRVDAAIGENDKIQRALAKRKRVLTAVVGEYVKAAESMGFHAEARFKKPAYYRHQVLEYANGKGISGTGRRLQTPSGRGFLKHRKGSEYDINTDYIEAEFEVTAQMLYDTEVMKTLAKLRENYDIINRLKTEAMETNHENIMAFFEQMAEDQNAQNAAVEALGGKHQPEVSGEKLYRAKLNWKQAKGFADLARLANEGELPDTPDHKYEDILDKLAEAQDAFENNLEAWKELDKEERIEQGRPSVSLDFSKEEMDKLFEYMGWVLSEHGKGPGAKESALVFKGIRQKREFIKKELGKQYVTWEDMIPEGYVEWQPREGHVFYFAESLPEKLARTILEEGMKQVTGEDLKEVLVVGQKRTAWVIPEGLAETLEKISPPTPAWLDRQAKKGLRAWKVYILSAPQRLAKYNIRNLTGDADAVFVGNPSTFKRVPQAVKELYDLFVLRKPMSAEMQEWFNRGGMESTLQAQELGDLKGLRYFQRFYDQKKGVLKVPETIFKKYWRIARLSTDFREAILRYAAYLDYLNQVQKNPKMEPKNYGASLPQEIQGLSDPRDRAFRLSNELLGAYDEISILGQWLREHAIPFWSWKELNFRRYVRFVKNAARDSKSARGAGRRAAPWMKMAGYSSLRLGRLMIKMGGLWVMLQAYNWLVHPDEERELSPDVRNSVHVILGRDDKGKVKYFSRVGALGDFLAWFGLDAAPGMVSDLLSNRKTIGDIAKEMAKAPVNEIVQGLAPIPKALFEFASGREFFPDVFNARAIRDRGVYLAKQLDLDEEYKAIAGKPHEPYKERFGELFLYKSDPGEAAYHEILDMTNKFLKKFGKTGGSANITPRGNALYNMKQAHRYGQKEVEKKYLQDYIRFHLLEAGYTGRNTKEFLDGLNRGLIQTMRNMHPLTGLSKDEKEAFLKTLKPGDWQTLARAIKFYNDTLIGTSPVSEKDVENWMKK